MSGRPVCVTADQWGRFLSCVADQVRDAPDESFRHEAVQIGTCDLRDALVHRVGIHPQDLAALTTAALSDVSDLPLTDGAVQGTFRRLYEALADLLGEVGHVSSIEEER